MLFSAKRASPARRILISSIPVPVFFYAGKNYERIGNQHFQEVFQPMKRLCMTSILIFVFLFLMHSASVLAEEKKDETAKPYWKISGQLEEACKCDAACPCWFGSKPTHMNCGGQLVYFIERGTYGDTKLDGLAFARMGQSPDGVAMMDSFGNWVFDYLYIDEKADAAQRKALEDISWATMGKASAKVEVRYVPISRMVTGKEHKIAIGQVGTFSAHLIEGLLGVPTITNAPGADPIRAHFQQGKTSSFLYTDASQNWNQKDSNYMFTDFEVDSEQYAKYNGAMMKMMDEMKQQQGMEHKH